MCYFMSLNYLPVFWCQGVNYVQFQREKKQVFGLLQPAWINKSYETSKTGHVNLANKAN